MATLITNDGIMRVDDNYLMHWAKGSEAKNHKWIKRIWTGRGWRYQYKQTSDKIKASENTARRENANAKSAWDDYKENKVMAAIYKKASKIQGDRYQDYVDRKNVSGAIDRNNTSKELLRKSWDKNDAADTSATSAKYHAREADKAIRAKEDAKRQQASAIGAANRAKSKSVKSKAKKVIRKVSNAIKNPVTTTGTITTSDNKKITKTIKKKKRNNLSGGTFKDFETRKKLRIN